MIIDRLLEDSDETLLEVSLAKDEFHKTTTVDFFHQPGTVTKVYEDEKGTVLFVRGSNVLRLDIEFVNNLDARRNMKVMLEGFPKLVEMAKANGYAEVAFQSDSSILKLFCIKRLGFYESHGELRRII